MLQLASLARRMWLGLVMLAVTSLAALALTTIWNVSNEWYNWRSLTLIILIVGVLLLAVLKELGRPQNPYRHLDPRFAYLDAGPTGHLASASSGWLWHALPPAIVVAVIAISWVVT